MRRNHRSTAGGRQSAWRSSVGLCLVIGLALTAAMPAAHARSAFWDLLLGSLAYANVDPQRTLAQQPVLIEAALNRLSPQRPGVTDLYFVGMAGDGEEGVFRREVESVRKLFDARFGANSRSLALINSPGTVATLPLATPDNLRQVLAHIGQVMNPDEDVLFLFLTSHGGPDVFSIDAGPIHSDQLYS